MAPSLIDRTRALLSQRTEPLHVVAAGASVKLSWLQKFAIGRFPNAAAQRVQRVYDYLRASRSRVKRAA